MIRFLCNEHVLSLVLVLQRRITWVEASEGYTCSVASKGGDFDSIVQANGKDSVSHVSPVNRG